MANQTTTSNLAEALRGLVWRTLVCCTFFLGAAGAFAEQSKQVGNYTVHYVAFASTFISPEMARKYGIVRGRNRALVNISVLDQDSMPVQVTLSGTVKNLPGQVIPLQFDEVLEGDAVYYLTQTRFSDQEIMRFTVNFKGPDGEANELKFEQKMYWED